MADIITDKLGTISLSNDILTKANIGLWAFELDEGSAPRMYVDDTMLGLLGLKEQVPPEQTYHAWYDNIDKDSYDLVADAVAKMTVGHAEVQYPWHHPDGSTMIVRCGGRRNPEYKPGIRIEGTHQNVTEVLHYDEEERERLKNNKIQLAHEQLRSDVLNYLIDKDDDPIELLKSYAERLRALIGCDQVVYRDLEETRIMVNSSAIEDKWSVPESYCRQCQHFDAHHPMYKDGYTEMDNCQEGWQGIPVYEKCPIKSSLTRLVYCDGEIAGYLAIHYVTEYHHFTDTERKTIEEFTRLLSVTLSRYEAKKKSSELAGVKRTMNMFLSLSDEYDPVIVLDPESGEYDWYKSQADEVSINTSMTVHGDDLYQNIGIDGSSIIHEEDRAQFKAFYTRENMMKIARTGETQETENRWFLKLEGRYKWKYNKAVRMVDDNGKAYVVVGVIDTTEKKEEEVRKIEQQKLLEQALSMAQSANRAKTTFLNSMSHDIRTPMNAIIGYTGLAASHIDNKEQVKDYLGKISQSSDHLLSLINDVLDMSRIESGKMNLEEKNENLSDIIHTLRDIVQADATAKKLDFHVDAYAVKNEDIICDKLRLNQVLLNILSNAIKYTQVGGEVSMRVEEQESATPGAATFAFRVKDNGMGMTEEFLKTIFDPFTRVNSTTVSGIQGSGLGMAITKNIVDMMGGTIDIQSKPGKGTEVTIIFDFMLQSSNKKTLDMSELLGKRALVVDDDANTCKSVAHMLTELGMRDEWCTTGADAVAKATDATKNGDPFKVFILDWQMPDINGVETTRRIRKAIGEDIPIVILTAYDWADIEEDAYSAGVTSFARKPMFPSDLRQILTRCLGKEVEDDTPKKEEFSLDGKKILLVEDNELNREIATAILEEYGCMIFPAEDGNIAVEKMKIASPGDYDLVLMDIQMPTMDGYEATRQIRKLGTAISHIPIIAMTANAFEEDRRAAINAGMDEHIAKPIDMDRLKSVLARFLS